MRSLIATACLSLASCLGSLTPFETATHSEGISLAVRIALRARGAQPTGMVMMRIDDSAHARIDSVVVRAGLDPWHVQYVDYPHYEHWVINGGVDCQCEAVVYLGAPSNLLGRSLALDVVAVVPVGNMARYRVVVYLSNDGWRPLSIEALLST